MGRFNKWRNSSLNSYIQQEGISFKVSFYGIIYFLHSSYEKCIKNTLKPYSVGSAFPRGRYISVSRKSEQNKSCIGNPSSCIQTNTNVSLQIRQITIFQNSNLICIWMSVYLYSKTLHFIMTFVEPSKAQFLTKLIHCKIWQNSLHI